MRNTACDVTLDQHTCGHGDASSFQSAGQVVAWCQYSSSGSSLVPVLE